MKPRIAILCLFLWAVPLLSSARVSFERPDWRIAVDPATLAVTIAYAGGPEVALSQGGDQHAVSTLQQNETEASWTWDDGYRVSARLSDSDVIFSIRADVPGELTLLRQPRSGLGQALILPIAEGRYIPVDEPIWQTFLSQEFERINTTQDLSLPLWANEHGRFSASWLLLNPYNNRLEFTLSGQTQLSLALRHQFTDLALSQPMVIMLHISANNDALAGAKRYRRWLIDSGQFTTFADKLRANPQAQKLIGATHLYVWGTDLIGVKDVKNWPQFLQRLKSDNALAVTLRSLFDKEAKSALAESGKSPNGYQKKVLIGAFNSGLKALARRDWQTEEPDFSRLTAGYRSLSAQTVQAFGPALGGDPTLWGSGLSVATIAKLSAAGLTRLWIGLGDGWEGGLWHPEAVKAAVDAGFLIAPYDSYQTALPMGANPDWATAQLGVKAYESCAITQEDGSLKAGFQKSGYYTNPRCIRPWLEKRVTALASATGFNSWFLDAYATGMVFDDYSAAYPMSQNGNANENSQSMAWVSEALGMVTGSEDGNAVTAQGVFFAHGMQTPVIGWGDKDLSDPKSPYYLGRWYPNDEPSIFFKQAPLKEPYQTVYFAPAYRLPLYQTVFHDSVITSQHWLFDNLKLSNTLAENQLTQLFYNVPALYHISESALARRLPAIIAQDAFFRPLHEALINQSIIDFSWLSADRLVQRVTFSGGVTLVANFSTQPFTYRQDSLPALSVTAFDAVSGQRQSGYEFKGGE